MIKYLLSFFGKAAHDAPPRSTAARKAGAARNRAAPATPAADFRAVTVQSSGICCSAARQAAGVRLLMRAMPRLPLADCSMPESCKCRFRKIPDRRGADRRLLGGITTHRWYGGTENRQVRGRRNADLRAYG